MQALPTSIRTVLATLSSDQQQAYFAAMARRQASQLSHQAANSTIVQPKIDAETVSNDVRLASSKVFERYRSTLEFGSEHPGDISESGLLSSIPLPPLSYPNDGISVDMIRAGKLSKLQLEGVLYAGSSMSGEENTLG
jgi:hypothetical protein